MRTPTQRAGQQLADKMAKALYANGYDRELIEEALNPYGARAGSIALDLIRAHAPPRPSQSVQ